MFSLPMDRKMSELFYPYAPFFNLLLLTKPFEISRNASMTDSVIGSTSEWLSRQQRQVI